MRALVIYGTRWGGTVEVAEKIAANLSVLGISVDVADAKQSSRDINPYDLIVVGSGLRADKWTKETLAFLEKNKAILQTKKTALFVSCQMADRTGEAYRKAENLYLQKTAEQYGLKPLSLGFFGGFLDFSYSHGLFVDLLVRVNRRRLRKNGLDTTRVHDTRDWAAIKVWARSLAKTALQTS